MIKTLFDNPWISVKKIEEGEIQYIYSHESRCDGKIIAILPYREKIYKKKSYEFLLRREITPCWSLEPQLSAITGGYVSDLSIEELVRQEIKEETGYNIQSLPLIKLGTCRGTKSVDTVYYLFAVDLTGMEQGEIKGDGTVLEATGKVEWFDFPQSDDPLVSTLLLRLLCHFKNKETLVSW